MMLSENCFARLGAAPTDDRRTLSENASTAALLGGEDLESALSQLLQMNRRILAEISWFQETPRETAESFLEYENNLSEGKKAKIPSIENLGTVLSQANALYAFFEHWPAEDTDFFIGMCLSIDRLLSNIRLEEVFSAINADREAGGWEKIQDPQDIEEPLHSHLRELCRPAVKAAEKMAPETLEEAMNRIYETAGFDREGDVWVELSSAYHLKIKEVEEEYNTRIKQIMSTIPESGIDLDTRDFLDLKELMDRWCRLTRVLRKAPGDLQNDARHFCSFIRGNIVNAVNTGGESKEKSFQLHRGTQTITVSVTYQSKQRAIDLARPVISWAKEAFPEQTELIAILNEDDKTLLGLTLKESKMLENAKEEAKQKYHAW